MAGAKVSTRRLVPAGAGGGSPLARRAGRRELDGGAAQGLSPAASGPLGLGGLLDTGCELFVRRFAPCVLVSALAWVGAGLALRLAFGVDVEFLIALVPFFPFFWFLWLVVGLPIKVVTAGLLGPLVGADFVGRDVSAWRGLRAGAARTPGLIVLVVVAVGVSLPLLCACALPVLVGLWLLSVVPVVYVLESRGVRRALVRGTSLVWGWDALGRWLGFTVVTSFLFLPARLYSAVLVQPRAREFLQSQLSLRGVAFDLFTLSVNAFFLALSTGFLAVVTAVYCLDLRVRREALDLELDLDRLAARRA